VIGGLDPVAVVLVLYKKKLTSILILRVMLKVGCKSPRRSAGALQREREPRLPKFSKDSPHQSEIW
jgi:hypothetical protein